MFIVLETVPYLLSSAGNWIKAYECKENSRRPSKHAIYSEWEVSEELMRLWINFFLTVNITLKEASIWGKFQYPVGREYPTHPVWKPRYPPAMMTKTMTHRFADVTMACANVLCGVKTFELKALKAIKVFSVCWCGPNCNQFKYIKRIGS